MWWLIIAIHNEVEQELQVRILTVQTNLVAHSHASYSADQELQHREITCGEVRLILESRIDASPKSTTGQEDRTEERRKPAGLAGCTYLLPLFGHSHCNL